MADEVKNNEELPEEEEGIYTLTDTETGEEEDFELLGEAELDGKKYMAFIPVNGEEDCFVVLQVIPNEDGEVDLVEIDDDDEYDRVADYFEDEFFDEVDYDGGDDNK